MTALSVGQYSSSKSLPERNPSAPLCSGMKMNGFRDASAARQAPSTAIGTSRSMAATSSPRRRNVSSITARVPRMVSPMMSSGALAIPPANPGMPSSAHRRARAGGHRLEPLLGRLAGRHHRLSISCTSGEASRLTQSAHRRDLLQVGERRERRHRLQSPEHARHVAALPEGRGVRQRGGRTRPSCMYSASLY